MNIQNQEDRPFGVEITRILQLLVAGVTLVLGIAALATGEWRDVFASKLAFGIIWVWSLLILGGLWFFFEFAVRELKTAARNEAGRQKKLWVDTAMGIIVNRNGAFQFYLLALAGEPGNAFHKNCLQYQLELVAICLTGLKSLGFKENATLTFDAVMQQFDFAEIKVPVKQMPLWRNIKSWAQDILLGTAKVEN